MVDLYVIKIITLIKQGKIYINNLTPTNNPSLYYLTLSKRSKYTFMERSPRYAKEVCIPCNTSISKITVLHF